ncbi:MAG: Aspartyl/glutamyl-tRNA(Asn/Gln) amidotransferase subunit C [Microgenomates group bacterium GW2011_GWA1_48_10]|uniref:Aspartyl/glutamyl-tRNA(Asn/Gln) amidotransferase subunit C n=1 Tax=Candidatus Gottesmanbacteria bacterium RIFCSPHIGHO2_01_FULL_47_48 TaxID=1798381 RepID=A0A1F6A5L7_9BACT|nr:MAG: Aspartyl/glutamyl-tRNA(Asn/Gln) amidotransferase subunit C [Microgenomates group bacterium GW2011_GWA1_48_10]OGG19876.1 MAG: asparaginyl/glutamyl-tRNA amidotransferase subunit C [Candidatus Gottesmanbacteria bacterium RIFCSPHIGHO2_01_FULL_47_48]
MAKIQTLSTDEVKHVAKLANLSFDSEDLQKYLPQLSAILDFVGKLQEIDTKNIPATSQVTGLENIFREDEVDATRMLSQEDALSNAKETHNGFFKVPAIFE